MIKLPAYFTGFASKSDGSASLRFNTQEISAEEFAELKRHHSAFGWLLFSASETEVPEIPKETIEDTSKSASTRLRSVLFIYWKQKVNEGDFDTWYRQKMEMYIEAVKNKLE